MCKFILHICILKDPLALRGGVGEKSVRQILSHANRVAERSLPGDSDAVRKLCGDITAMTDALCELRQEGKGATPQVIKEKGTKTKFS